VSQNVTITLLSLLIWPFSWHIDLITWAHCWDICCISTQNLESIPSTIFSKYLRY